MKKRAFIFLICICMMLPNITAYAAEFDGACIGLVCLGANVGNTAYEATPEIKMDIKNPTSSDINVSGTYTVADSTGDAVETGNIEAFTLYAKTATVKDVPVKITKYGTYTVSVFVNDITASIQFSIIHSGGSSSQLGAQTHFAFKTREQPENAVKHIADAGFGCIRDELYWVDGDSGELTNPTYKIPGYVQNTLKYAKENGIKVLLNINYVHTCYDYGRFPTLAADRYAKYCAYVVRTLEEMGYGDTVLAYEIWNEPNLKGNAVVNTSGTPSADGETRNITAEEYRNLLKKAYDAIKYVNSEVIVVGGSLTSQYANEGGQTGFEFMEDLLDGWNKDNKFMDAISFHPYTYQLKYPDETSNGTFLEQIAQAEEILSSAGASELPIWVSEFGFSSYSTETEAISERMQAIGIVRSAVQSRSRDSIGFMSIYNYREKRDGTGKEENYGIVDTSAYPKDAYAALAFYNSLLGGAEYRDCYENEYSLYHFTDEEYLKEVLAVWGNSGVNPTLSTENGDAVTYIANETGVKVTLPTDYELVIYDLFGNEIGVISDSEAYSVGSEIVYAAARPTNGSIICKDGTATVIGNGEPADNVTVLVKDAKTDFSEIKYIGQAMTDSNGDFKFKFPIEDNDIYSVYVYNSDLDSSNINTAEINSVKYTLYNNTTDELIDSKEKLFDANQIRIETKAESKMTDSLVMFAVVCGTDGVAAAANSSLVAADGTASVILVLPDNASALKLMLWTDNLSPVIKMTEI